MKRRTYLSGIVGTGVLTGPQIIGYNTSSVRGSSVSITPRSKKYLLRMSDIKSLVVTFENIQLTVDQINKTHPVELSIKGKIDNTDIGTIEKYQVNIENNRIHIPSLSVDITDATGYDSSLIPQSMSNSVDVEFTIIASHPSINTITDSTTITINYGGKNVIAETGRTQISDTIDSGTVKSISYQSIYDNPIVTAYIPTRNGDQSVDVRVKNVGQSSCDIFLKEPDNGSHPTETVCYIVAEQGSWTTPKGYHIEAGSLNTDSVHDASDGEEHFNGVSVSFNNSFSSPPVVLGTLNTNNNQDFATVVTDDVQTGSFKTEQSVLEASSNTTTEKIGWIAIEQNSGEFSTGSKWKAKSSINGNNDGVPDTRHKMTYSSLSFNSQPDLITSLQTLNGWNGAYARGESSEWNTSEGYAYAEEDATQSGRSHTDEEFGYFVTEPNTIIYKS